MEDDAIIACVIVLIAVLVFALGAIWFFSRYKLGGPGLLQRWDSAWEKILQATRLLDRVVAVVLGFLVVLFGGGLGTYLRFITILAGAIVIGASPCVGDDTLLGEIANYFWGNFIRPFFDSIRPSSLT